ncbi:MAG TPA: NPCBM/NEW2 domain-containing protein [Pirellulaceae bacterium]
MFSSPFQQPGANLLPVICQHGLLMAVIGCAEFAVGDEKLVNAAEKTVFTPTLVLVDDSIVSAPSLTIADGRVTGDGVPAELTLDDLRRIFTYDEDDYLANEFSLDEPITVELRAGGRVHAKKVAIGDEKIKIEWRAGWPLELPIDLVRGLQIVWFTEAKLLADAKDYEKSLAAPPATLDRVLLRSDDGQISSISGLVESLDADNLTFDANGQKRSIPRSKLSGIVFAQPAPSTRKPPYTIKFRDGSELAGDKFSLADGKGTLEIAPQAAAHFNWLDVYEVFVRSTRLEYLSDWPLLPEEQTPIVTPPFPVQRDKSVSGNRLRVGHLERFDKGLGVHARSAITFATEGKWDLFKAKIGLDAEADGKGDCIFQVLADGKSIFEKRMKGDGILTHTEDVRLPITGCRELTLLVEPGAGLDLADHANWCDARLTKAKR